MATNDGYQPGNRLSLPCSAPATPKSGDAVMVGDMPAVALTNEGDGGNLPANTSVQTDGVWWLYVRGENAAGAGAAITVPGTRVYFDAAMAVNDPDGNPIRLNLDATNGKSYGYCLDPVASGANARVRVKVGY